MQDAASERGACASNQREGPDGLLFCLCREIGDAPARIDFRSAGHRGASFGGTATCRVGSAILKVRRNSATHLIAYMKRELYNPDKWLCRLYDFSVGEENTICGRTMLSEDFHERAYHQADLLDCLVDVERLTRE